MDSLTSSFPNLHLQKVFFYLFETTQYWFGYLVVISGHGVAPCAMFCDGNHIGQITAAKDVNHTYMEPSLIDIL